MNNHGFTLPEMIAAIFLFSLLAYGFTLGMLQFVLNYQETRDFIQLQNDMLNVIQTVKHGYFAKGIHDNVSLETPLVGLLTAQRVSIPNLNEQITIYPIEWDRYGVDRYWSRIRLDQNSGKVFLDGQFATQYVYNKQLFPTQNEKAGRDQRFRVTKLEFQDLTSESDVSRLVNIVIEGEVRYRTRGFNAKNKLQSLDDDRKMNVRKVVFENTVYLGNSDKSNLVSEEG